MAYFGSSGDGGSTPPEEQGFFSRFFGFIGDCFVAFFEAIGGLLSVIPWAIVLPILVVLALLPGIWGLVSFVKMDREGPWYNDQIYSFVSGDINDKGRVVDDDAALYTKDLIKCDAIRITYPFGKNYFFEVHYFTSDDTWITGEVITISDVYTFEMDDVPSLELEDGTLAPAAGVRIVIRSNDGEPIGFWEKSSARKCLEIDVYRQPTSEKYEDATDAAA